MKAKHILAVSAAFMLIAGVGFISYGFKGEENSAPTKDKQKSEMRKIQVIRSYQGLVTTYDTLVPASSSYDENDYLAELGFEEDQNLNIIKISGDMLDMNLDFSEFHCLTKDGDKDNNWTGNNFHMAIDLRDFEEEMEELGKELEVMGEELEKELGEMKFEHKIIIDKDGNGEGSEELEKEIEILLKDLGESFYNSFEMDTTFEEDGTKMRVMCNMSAGFDGLDDSSNVWKFMSIDDKDFDIDFDFDFDLDEHSNAFFFAPCDKMKMQVECDGDSDEDFTVVIVTEGSAEELERTGDIEENEKGTLEVYPNPTSDYFQLKLDFDKKKANDFPDCGLEWEGCYGT